MKGGYALRSTSRRRVLLISSAVILLCIMIITGMSYALFTDDEIVENHLKAGDLDVTLKRTKLVSTYLNSKGFMSTETDTEEKDFTNDTSENVFAIDGTLIVPTTKYVADMIIINNSNSAESNVAFSYWVEIVYNGLEDVALADQIQVVVKDTTTEDGTTVIQKLSQGAMLGDEENPIGVVAVGESATFYVGIEFLDLEGEVNNLAQGQTVNFDLIVHAVQCTDEPKPGTNP